MVDVVRIANYLKKYLIIYVLLMITTTLPIEYYNASYFKTHEGMVKNVILSLITGILLPFI